MSRRSRISLTTGAGGPPGPLPASQGPVLRVSLPPRGSLAYDIEGGTAAAGLSLLHKRAVHRFRDSETFGGEIAVGLGMQVVQLPDIGNCPSGASARPPPPLAPDPPSHPHTPAAVHAGFESDVILVAPAAGRLLQGRTTLQGLASSTRLVSRNTLTVGGQVAELSEWGGQWEGRLTQRFGGQQ